MEARPEKHVFFQPGCFKIIKNIKNKQGLALQFAANMVYYLAGQNLPTGAMFDREREAGACRMI